VSVFDYEQGHLQVNYLSCMFGDSRQPDDFSTGILRATWEAPDSLAISILNHKRLQTVVHAVSLLNISRRQQTHPTLLPVWSGILRAISFMLQTQDSVTETQ